jgi:hypothetical protein
VLNEFGNIFVGEHAALVLAAAAHVDVAKLAVANITLHGRGRDTEYVRGLLE